MNADPIARQRLPKRELAEGFGVVGADLLAEVGPALLHPLRRFFGVAHLAGVLMESGDRCIDVFLGGHCPGCKLISIIEHMIEAGASPAA